MPIDAHVVESFFMFFHAYYAYHDVTVMMLPVRSLHRAIVNVLSLKYIVKTSVWMVNMMYWLIEQQG